jgi:hypothetical protein
MLKRRKWLMLMVGAGLTLALVAIFTYEPEPFYQGRFYRDWLNQADLDMRAHDCALPPYGGDELFSSRS